VDNLANFQLQRLRKVRCVLQLRSAVQAAQLRPGSSAEARQSATCAASGASFLSSGQDACHCCHGMKISSHCSLCRKHALDPEVRWNFFEGRPEFISKYHS
jgi:hypothetical protein